MVPGRLFISRDQDSTYDSRERSFATGRLIAPGQYQFGTDPFSYTSTAYWANHTWLYDLILYGLATASGGPESEAGGAFLVVIKALLVTLLAWVMVLIRRPGQSLW